MIRSLGEDVRSRLRSGIAVSSLTQCIDELVVNSLDAGASCITVRVDIPTLRVQISDNGSGIARDDLDVLGERYATSKCHSLNDLDNIKSYGYRGEALASICDIAGILEVVTRHKSSYKTYCKIFNGKAVKVTESCVPRSNVGTTVTAYDVFSSLPVRRKLISDVFDFEKIRQRLASIALINPGVSFSLYNDATGQNCLLTRKCQSVSSTFSQLFGNLKAKTLQGVGCESGNVRVSGYISLLSHHSKSLQFIYVNGRLLIKTKLHKLVNQILNKSLLLKKTTLAIHDNEQTKEEQPKSPANHGAEKYSIFVLNITCPVTDYDITLEPAKTLVEFEDWEGVLEVTKKCTKSFLIKHNLLLQADEESLEPSETEDSNDSQLCLSIYEYQSGNVNTSPIISYSIHPDNIKKSLQSSVVSRPTNQDCTSAKSCEGAVVLTEKTEKLMKDGLVVSGSHNQLVSTTTSLKVPEDNTPHRPPPSLLGKTKNTRRISSRNCFTSPNPITLQSRRTHKTKQSSDTNTGHHNKKTMITSNTPSHSSIMFNTPRHSNVTVNTPSLSSITSTVITSSGEGTITHSIPELEKFKFSQKISESKKEPSFSLNAVQEEKFDDVDDDDDDNHEQVSDCCSSDDKDFSQPLICDKEGDMTSMLNEEVISTTVTQPSPIDNSDVSPSLEEKDWQITYDNNLQRNIYFNIRSGNTLFECPVDNDSQNQDSQANMNQHHPRNPAPLACAPHVSFDCTPWLPRDGRQQRAYQQVPDVVSSQEIESSSTRQDNSLVRHMLDNWENPVFESASEMDVTMLSKPTVLRNDVSRLCNAVYPYRFTKDTVKSLRVIQQVDNKFIICQLRQPDNNSTDHDSLIVLLDQHAVHERIRLEQLISDMLEKKSQDEKSSLAKVKSSAISPPIELEFTPHELLLITRFRNQLERVGVKFVISPESSSSHSIMVHELPCALVEREVSETRRRRPSVAVSIVKELIESHVEHLKQTNGVSPVIPKTIYRVLSSQACHGAIKFGEYLSTNECEHLIQQLSTCDLPFQCAHGRPSIIPLVDLKLLKSNQLKSQTACKPPQLQRLTNAIRN